MNIPIINSIVSYLRGDGAVILPEIELVLFGLGILVIDFWFEQKEKYMNAGLALAGTVFSAFTLWRLRTAVAVRGEFAGFHDSVVVDPFFLFFSVLFLAATALVLLLSVKFLEIEREQEGEYYALLLFACVGMMLMASGIDLIVLFLGLETMALSFYVLTGFLRREKRSNEASLKFVLLGAFSSGILAYGFSLLYGLSDSTNIDTIGEMLGQRNAFITSLLHNPQSVTPAFDPFLLQLLPVLAFVFVAVGLFFKVAAVPFHQWAPDVYEGAPTPVTMFVSVASKTASFALLLRLFLVVFGATRVNWMYLVAGIAVASLTWGNLAALTQTNVKRLLAYSSKQHIAHVRNGRVRQQALHVGLRQRGKVSPGERGNGDACDQIHPVHARGSEDHQEQPEKQRKAGSLGRDADEHGDRCRRALVDIRRPLVKRHRRNLKEQSDRHEDERQNRQQLQQEGIKRWGHRLWIMQKRGDESIPLPEHFAEIG